MSFSQMKSNQLARIDLTPPPYGSSQDANLTQTQTSDILTQNHDLTQLGDDDGAILSPLPPFSPGVLRTLPWGRLMPTITSRPAFDLLPRQPNDSKTMGGVSFLGIEHLHSSDVFNEYTIGRSPKCDLQALKPEDGNDADENNRQQWAYGVISNRHCRIFCCLDSSLVQSGIGVPRMQVFLEDTSGNGTIVNQTTILRRGEKRMLHTGDEICLVNPHTLKKKIRSATVLKELLSQHSFVFVNLHQQQPGFTAQVLKSWQMNPPSTVGKKRKPAVNVREIRQHSNYVGRSPAGDVVNWRTLQNRQIANKLPCIGRRVEEEYDIRDLLGSGTVGEVRRAIHRKSGEERAVKIISIGGRNRGLMQVQPSTALQAEANILQKLKHPYVVQLFDVYHPTPSSHNLYLVMELLHGGDLFDRIVEKGKYTETESRRVMRRLLNAIHYLHEDCNIVHRDLKPENILCVHRGPVRCIEVKITDFGLAKTVNGCQESLKTFCGTPQYFAPEVLKRRTTVAGRGRYGKPADMWSLGVILYVLLSGTHPFDVELDDAIIMDNHIDGDSRQVRFPSENWNGISEAARDLIRRLLDVDTNRRCNVRQACDHEWLLVDDSDTHIHPLSDPAVKEFRANIASNEQARKQGNEVDLMSKLSVDDSGVNNLCHSSPHVDSNQIQQCSPMDTQYLASNVVNESCLNETCNDSLPAGFHAGEVASKSPQSNESPQMAIDDPSPSHSYSRQIHISSPMADNHFNVLDVMGGSCSNQSNSDITAAHVNDYDGRDESSPMKNSPLMTKVQDVSSDVINDPPSNMKCIITYSTEGDDLNVGSKESSCPLKSKFTDMDDVSTSETIRNDLFDETQAILQAGSEVVENSSGSSSIPHDTSFVKENENEGTVSNENSNTNALKAPRNLLAFCTPSDKSREFLKKNAKIRHSDHNSSVRRPLSPVRVSNRPENGLQNESNLTALFDALSTPPTSNCNPARVSDFPNDVERKSFLEDDDVMSFPSDRSESIASFSSSNSKTYPLENREPCEKPKKRKAAVVDTENPEEAQKNVDEVIVNKRIKKQEAGAKPASMQRQTTLSSWFTKCAN